MMSGNRRHAEVPRLFLLIFLEMSCCQRNLEGTERSLQGREGRHNRGVCRREGGGPTEESEGARGGHRVICRVDTTEESAGARGGHNRVICRRRGGTRQRHLAVAFFVSLLKTHVCSCMWESGGIAVAWAPIPLTVIKGVWALFNISHILWKSLHTATDNLESLRNVAGVSCTERPCNVEAESGNIYILQFLQNCIIFFSLFIKQFLIGGSLWHLIIQHLMPNWRNFTVCTFFTLFLIDPQTLIDSGVFRLL